jgi:serine/threonine protein kinase
MGSGATGVIYEAVRMSDGMPVAIKLLRAAAAHEAVASDRLRREAEALGLAWHPNVVEVIDHGHLPDGTAYLAMELLRGESLAARVQAKGRLSPHELLPIGMQVCEALAAVHAAGVVHRDLKPSNIFLAVDSEGPAATERVKLLDFGIARVEWEETRITNTGGPLGTPGYMSPEQEAGAGEIDARSDLFSLGAVLFECLVGEPPPPQQTPSGLVRMRSPGASGLRLDSGTQKAASVIPPAWRAVIEKAMAVEPAKRFADARSFAQALRALGEDVAEANGSS